MNFKPKALLFDLNGTMIDDMEYHNQAWSSILNNDLNAGLSHEEVKLQMYGKNEELLARVFGPGKFTQEEMDKIAIKKEKYYQSLYLPYLKLIPGLEKLMNHAKLDGISMAICSAAIPFNIDFVLDTLQIRSYFQTIVSAHDVKQSKPDPETFLKAATLLNCLPEDCLVFEDAPKGVEAAQHAGMKCIALSTTHAAKDFEQYANLLAIVKDYEDPFFDELVLE